MIIKLLGIYSLIIMASAALMIIKDGLSKENVGALIFLFPVALFILFSLKNIKIFI